MTAVFLPLPAPRGLAALSAAAPPRFVPNAKAAERFFESFTATIRNRHTRRAYYKGRRANCEDVFFRPSDQWSGR